MPASATCWNGSNCDPATQTRPVLLCRVHRLWAGGYGVFHGGEVRRFTGYSLDGSDWIRYTMFVYAGPGLHMATHDGKLLLLREGTTPARPIRAILAEVGIDFRTPADTPLPRHYLAKRLWTELRPSFHAKRRELGL